MKTYKIDSYGVKHIVETDDTRVDTPNPAYNLKSSLQLLFWSLSLSLLAALLFAIMDQLYLNEWILKLLIVAMFACMIGAIMFGSKGLKYELLNGNKKPWLRASILSLELGSVVCCLWIMFLFLNVWIGMSAYSG